MHKTDSPQLPELSALDLSRVPPHTNVNDFLRSLEELQVPCPWGDLTKGEGIPNEFPNMPELNQIPNIPLALIIGAGTPIDEAYESVACAASFGKIIHSDQYDPRFGSSRYIRLDLNEPETINLFGFQVHAIMSISVFTYDGLGVNFKSKEAEFEAAKKLNEMLMPGGIIANANIYHNRRFERILIEHFGFKVVRDTHSIILQKPFRI